MPRILIIFILFSLKKGELAKDNSYELITFKPSFWGDIPIILTPVLPTSISSNSIK